ncbi:MAG TPA: hypothetical protein VH079_15470 [Terriglobales bacterium]|jgi:hypothetical protein|nr:hypothetical protein [Terriglobales bacterium]
MKTFLKIVLVVFVVLCFVSLATQLSMYYWPNIPAVPDPGAGRTYSLNNHGRYTYMNRNEYLLHEVAFWTFIICLLGTGAIEQFLDPFDHKRRPRPFDPNLPPWRNRH